MWTLEKILERCAINQKGCYIWQGAVNTDGYARIGVKGNCNVKVHRLVMELTGRNPDGKVVRHKCDTPLCLNPDHLELGTPYDNVRDKVERGRQPCSITRWHVTEVKRLRNEGMLQKEIAHLVKLDARRVSDILTGKRDENGRIAKLKAFGG